MATAALLALAACTQAPAPVDPSVITSRSDAWEEALNAKDIEALVALYTGDARLMPPDGATVSGSEAVREIFGGMIDAGVGVTLTTVEAAVSGDMGHNIGTYTTSVGGEVVDTGKFVEIWQRGDDGMWRIAADIWNSDGAQEAAAEDHSHMMIVHIVEDGDYWMDAWRGEDSRRKLFTDNGASHVRTFRSADNPNLTGLVIGIEDLAALRAMLASAEGAAAAAADGVDIDNITVLMETR